jgi:hypothetical protein
MGNFLFGKLVNLRPEMNHTIGETCGSIKKKGIFPKSRSRNPKGKKNRLANGKITMIHAKSPMEPEVKYGRLKIPPSTGKQRGNSFNPAPI